jgi:hypothetical protein
MREEYKITVLNQLKSCWTIFVGIGVAVLCFMYMRHKYGTEDTETYIKFIIIFFSLLFVPHIFLHLRYYSLNKRDVFYYYPHESKIKIRTSTNDEVEFYLKDIKQVHYFKSFPLAEERMQWFPWDNYSFARIYLQNGKQFLITSLVVPNMKLPISESKVRLSKTFYAYPLKKERELKE